MVAYVIADVEVLDSDGYEAYGRQVPATSATLDYAPPAVAV
jgi:uncharacterized protein (DUF1330 family)